MFTFINRREKRERKSNNMKKAEKSRLCSYCSEEKPLTEDYFHKDKRRKGGFNHYCKVCRKEYGYLRYKKNINKERERYHSEEGRDLWLNRKYNITSSEYDIILKAQKNCCAICGKHISKLKIRLCVDHDHNTGEIRGLLCGNCNKGLGFFDDSVALLVKATKYLK